MKDFLTYYSNHGALFFGGYFFADGEGETMNTNDGYDYAQKDWGVAKKVDLVTLPEKVEGTNCANCKYVKVLDAEKGTGYCWHPSVQLPVTARMCCALWDAEGTLRSWKLTEAE